MPERRLDGMRIAILVTNGFEQSELTEPRKALDDAGAATRVIALEAGRVTAMKHDEKGDTFNVDFTLDRILPGFSRTSDR